MPVIKSWLISAYSTHQWASPAKQTCEPIEDDGNKQTRYAEGAYDELATVRKIIVSCSNSVQVAIYTLCSSSNAVRSSSVRVAVHCVQAAVHCVQAMD